MSAPIRFIGVDRDDRLLVRVGKSPELRPIEITTRQAERIIIALAHRLADDATTKETP